jgi:hypothetical protein
MSSAEETEAKNIAHREFIIPETASCDTGFLRLQRNIEGVFDYHRAATGRLAAHAAGGSSLRINTCEQSEFIESLAGC